MQIFTLNCDYDTGAPLPVFADLAEAEAAGLAFYVEEWRESWGDVPETYEDAQARYMGQYLCEIVTHEIAALQLTDRQTATILAALRMWQTEAVGVRDELPYDDIATNDGRLVALDAAEIDALCEALNLGAK